MNRTHALTLVATLAVACLSNGCALLSKSDPVVTRYFSMETAGATSPKQETPPPTAAKLPEVRLGSITGALYLEERLVFRTSANEIRYYRGRRWLEPPEASMKRMLLLSLFEQHGLQQTLSGAGPTLDVHLAAFDEIRLPHRLARIQVVVRLRNDRVVLWQETLSVDRLVVEEKDGDRALETVLAFETALATAMEQVAQRVIHSLPAPQ